MSLQKRAIRSALTSQRRQLSQLVAGLTSAQLDAPSLCDGWSNRAVLSHILSFELHSLDFWQLVLKFRAINDITANQTKRYTDCSPAEYHRLLTRGHKRMMRLLAVTPTWLLNRKLIPVPNGRLSLGQLFGDIVVDRAVHALDITHGLGLGSRIESAESMAVCLDFLLTCIDLLNPKIPQEYHGEQIVLRLSGLAARTVSWTIGTSTLSDSPAGKALITVASDTNDLLFTIIPRAALVQRAPTITGNKQLADLITRSFNANALWEG